jgi:hypothetical protein
MKKQITLGMSIIATALAVWGCNDAARPVAQSTTPTAVARGAKQSPAQPAPTAEEEAEIKENLAKLSPEDRKLADAQRFCAIDEDHRLGEMGVPYKVMIMEQPVLLCCKGCEKDAKNNPEKTLAKVKELKAKVAAEASKEKK